ncbi:MAG: hypothetical protein ACPGO5_00150 [Patescibacteria group bacterium]
MDFKEIISQTEKLADEFKAKEQREWGVEAMMVELMKQVGQLSQHVMMHEEYYLAKRDQQSEYDTSKQHIADELFDVIFMSIRIARHYNIDLEKEYVEALQRAHEYVSK